MLSAYYHQWNVSTVVTGVLVMSATNTDVRFFAMLITVTGPNMDLIVSPFSERWKPNWPKFLEDIYGAPRLCLRFQIRCSLSKLERMVSEIEAKFRTSRLLVKFRAGVSLQRLDFAQSRLGRGLDAFDVSVSAPLARRCSSRYCFFS